MREEAERQLKYKRLKADLKKRILDGTYPDGICLPSEREISGQYSVSRMTIRKAIDELAKEGFVYRLQGKGTFVACRRIRQPLSKITSFSDDMRQRGLTPDAKILALDVIPASSEMSERMQCVQGELLILLKRLRLASNEPMAIESMYLRHAYCKLILPEIANGISVYSLLRDRLGILLVKAEQSIEIAPLQPWEANILGNESLKDALYIQRRSFDDNGNVVEFVESKYRGDRYTFYVELSGV